MLLLFYNNICACLFLVAQRTYVFAADTEAELKEWKATMDNCMAKFISGGSRTEHTRVVSVFVSSVL